MGEADAAIAAAWRNAPASRRQVGKHGKNTINSVGCPLVAHSHLRVATCCICDTVERGHSVNRATVMR